MIEENINIAFLDGVMKNEYPDIYYHLGVSTNDSVLDHFRDVKAVVIAGSGDRIKIFAEEWAEKRNKRIFLLPKEERFVTCYCDGVLFVSHGMGMPSASICVQELMRLVYFLKDGDLEKLDEVFWCRVGTSGGVGCEPGTVIVTTESLMVDMKPYRVLIGKNELFMNGNFPMDIAEAIIKANQNCGFGVKPGKTVSGNDFFLEQMRTDGAICLIDESRKIKWLNWIHENGVRNIEMESALLAGFMNHWGFSRFATICVAIVNRLKGDQIESTQEQLLAFNENSGIALFNYLETIM